MADKSFNIRLAGIELIEKSMALPPQSPVDGSNYNFNFSVDLKIGPEEKVGIVLTDVTIVSEVNEVKKEVGKFKTVMGFELPDFHKIIKRIDDNIYDVPVELEIILKSAGISTIRGVIFSELRGTYLQSIVLPLIDIATLIQKQRAEIVKQK